MTITVVLSLLCLAIAGRELYLAFERRRTAAEPEIAELRARVAALGRAGDEVARLRADHGERLDSLALEQLRTTGTAADLDDAVRALARRVDESLAPEVAALRRHLVARLDQAVAASLGADPVDTVAGALSGDSAALAPAYERFVTRFGMRVELTDERDGIVRHYLSGRSPRALERDFIDLLRVLRAALSSGTGPGSTLDPERAADGGDVAAARRLLAALRDVSPGGAQVGPLVLVRTADALLCGVLPLAELRVAGTDPLADPSAWTQRLRRLPPGRLCDATATTAL
ncbi:hypothetical protein [Actinomadura oligospora]|uniref:hypothetical protein n=1 Tax=Actinomadura oligospora TaxID=111804 RepID=UPI00047CBA4C|nr:hypothetical protein [Actinomadura oligospora]